MSDFEAILSRNRFSIAYSGLNKKLQDNWIVGTRKESLKKCFAEIYLFLHF